MKTILFSLLCLQLSAQFPQDKLYNYFGCGITVTSGLIFRKQTDHPVMGTICSTALGCSVSIFTPKDPFSTIWGAGVGGFVVGISYTIPCKRKPKHKQRWNTGLNK